MTQLRLGYYSDSSVVLLHALSPLHVGTGRSGGVADLPVQRDALGFPTIFASSLKGPLRASFSRANEDKKKCVDVIFGPSRGEDSDYYAGAVSILDAKLLFLPVRSLKGVYLLCTSPYLLNNFARYIEAAAYARADALPLNNIRGAVEKVLKLSPKEDEIFLGEQTKARFSTTVEKMESVILADEFKISPEEHNEVSLFVRELLGEDEASRVAVVHDDFMINSLIERSLIRRTRVALETSTKRVKSGALWTEEDIPPQTVFQTVFFYSEPRTSTDGCEGLARDAKASQVKELLENSIFQNKSGYMIFGGHETIGRGIVKIRKVD
ncbi:MAG: type III-B CRISPR module RAMP protein Cmr4 [Candidatus Caldarchaeum sp.]|nr:type III-B CRISPR module RAMP protein Cmr4 [Candidatus Caldarchaeum sp.]